MKRVFSTLALTAICFAASAQDIIVLKDASEIEAKVSKVTSESIEYQKWSNLDGPAYQENINNVLFIKYQNGEKDVFNTTVSTKKGKSEKTSNASSLTNDPVRFQCNLYANSLFTEGVTLPGIDASFGVKYCKYFFSGVNVGFNIGILNGGNRDASALLFPIGANFRGYIPTKSIVKPFGDLVIGTGILTESNRAGSQTGCLFNFQVLAGMNIKCFSFGLGYNRLENLNLFVLKLGVTLGK